MRDLASDPRPQSYRLWGTDSQTQQLYRIDVASSTATSVGSFSNDLVRAIAYDTSREKLFGISQDSGMLYEINPTNAALTLVGPLGVNAQDAATLGAFGADAFGNLYTVSEISRRFFSINAQTGAATLVGLVDVEYIADLAVLPEDNVMFGVGFFTSSIYTIDVATGAATLIGPYGANEVLAGLAFGPVPEPGTGLLVLSALAMFGRRASRRN